MAASSRRVVVTGLGVVTPVGQDVTSFWTSLSEGRGGVRTIRGFDTSGLPVHFAGEVPDFDPKKYVEKNERKSLLLMARTIQLGVAGAKLALLDGAVDKSKLDPTRFGVEFGAGMIASELLELSPAARASDTGRPGEVDLEKWGRQGIGNAEVVGLIPPKWMLKYLPNMSACHVSILHDAQGPNNTITECDVAGVLALGEAFRLLARDAADFFLVGGAESKINPLSMVRLSLFEALSRCNDAPEKACRPFDSGRDGIVLGEGAGVLAVEDLAHAQRRGARIYAEVVGFGASFDARCTGAGLARAVRAALKEANVGPEEVDHVNAHGLSTREADVWEARGLNEVFGESTPVFAAKGYLGNLGAGAGTTELAASLLALHHGVLPRTLNHEEPDPECPVHVTRQPRPVTKPYAVKVGCTQMGQCAAVVVRKWG
jgi:3-oxoacyl-[acyl-carrier-protein] synthase II